MTALTAPAPQAHIAANNGEKPINLFQLGCLFVIRASYWSCRIGNEPHMCMTIGWSVYGSGPVNCC